MMGRWVRLAWFRETWQSSLPGASWSAVIAVDTTPGAEAAELTSAVVNDTFPAAVSARVPLLPLRVGVCRAGARWGLSSLVLVASEVSLSGMRADSMSIAWSMEGSVLARGGSGRRLWDALLPPDYFGDAAAWSEVWAAGAMTRPGSSGLVPAAVGVERARWEPLGGASVVRVGGRLAVAPQSGSALVRWSVMGEFQLLEV